MSFSILKSVNLSAVLLARSNTEALYTSHKTLSLTAGCTTGENSLQACLCKQRLPHDMYLLSLHLMLGKKKH